MAYSTWTDDHNNTFSTPYIPDKIVGFHGIDPDLVDGGGSGGGGGSGTAEVIKDHEKLDNLLGGDMYGHWHVSENEIGFIYSTRQLANPGYFQALKNMMNEIYSTDTNGNLIMDSTSLTKLADFIDARINAALTARGL